MQVATCCMCVTVGQVLLFHENIKRSQGRRSMCESVAPVLWLGLLAGAQNEKLQIFTGYFGGLSLMNNSENFGVAL